MNLLNLSQTIVRLWPQLPEDHTELICKRLERTELPDALVVRVLEAEWARPANMTARHERIIRALSDAAQSRASPVPAWSRMPIWVPHPVEPRIAALAAARRRGERACGLGVNKK